MKRKQLSQLGHLHVGQRVTYRRPDPATVGQGIAHWKYLTGEFNLTAIERCETGALITLTEGADVITAHVHIGLKGQIYIPEASLRVLREAPRQMELAA